MPPFRAWRAREQGDGRGSCGTVCLFQHQHFPGSRSRRVSRALIGGTVRTEIFFWEAKMKVIVLLVALCSFSEVAVAQSTQCQSVPKASDRLACYDRAAPPMAAANPTTSKTRAGPANPAASETPPDQGRVVDMLAAENSKLDAKLKTICRGC